MILQSVFKKPSRRPKLKEDSLSLVNLADNDHEFRALSWMLKETGMWSFHRTYAAPFPTVVGCFVRPFSISVFPAEGRGNATVVAYATNQRHFGYPTSSRTHQRKRNTTDGVHVDVSVRVFPSTLVVEKRDCAIRYAAFFEISIHVSRYPFSIAGSVKSMSPVKTVGAWLVRLHRGEISDLDKSRHEKKKRKEGKMQTNLRNDHDVRRKVCMISNSGLIQSRCFIESAVQRTSGEPHLADPWSNASLTVAIESASLQHSAYMNLMRQPRGSIKLIQHATGGSVRRRNLPHEKSVKYEAYY